jgi:hypothetical protein
MAHTQPLFTRLTHQYRDGWSYLDTEEFTASVKLLGATRRTPSNSYEGGGTCNYRVVAPSALKGTDLTRAISHSFGGSSCQHEHDCCGCATVSIDVLRVSRREYVVRSSISFNV